MGIDSSVDLLVIKPAGSKLVRRNCSRADFRLAAGGGAANCSLMLDAECLMQRFRPPGLGGLNDYRRFCQGRARTRAGLPPTETSVPGALYSFRTNPSATVGRALVTVPISSAPREMRSPGAASATSS